MERKPSGTVLRRPTIILTAFFTCSFLTLTLFTLWVTPKFVEAEYQFDDGEIQKGTLPLFMNTEKGTFTILLPVHLATLHPTSFVITPDDCLRELTINGNAVDLGTDELCDFSEGHKLDLGEYLTQGNNILEMTVWNRGGRGGIDMRTFPWGRISQLSLLGSMLTILGTLILLLQKEVARTGTILLLITEQIVRRFSRIVTPVIGQTRPIFFLLFFLTLGLGLRVLLADHPGYGFDIGVNKGWARSAAQLGIGISYREQIGGNMLPNYPPFSLWIFALVGHIYQSFLSPMFAMDLPVLHILIKMPAIVADLLTASLLALLFHWKSYPVARIVVPLLYLCHPAVLYNSAIWGQTDALYTLLLVAAIVALSFDRWGTAAALVTLSFLTKIQAVALAPLFVFLFATRPRVLLPSAGVAAGVVFVVLLPFLLANTLLDVARVYTHSVGYYSHLAQGAYNFWWSLFADAAWNRPDTDLVFGFVSYRNVGLAIFAIFYASILWILRRHLWLPENSEVRWQAIFLAASLVVYSFFIFNTEMHERYLFPLMALGLPIAVLSWRFAFLYLGASFFFLMNLLGILPFSSIDKALYASLPSLDVFVASAQMFLCSCLLLETWHWSTRKTSSVPAKLIRRWNA